MKKIAILFTALIFTVISCKDDPCDGVVNGSEVDGTCVCIEGYEGTTCETEIRSKFYGTWLGQLSGCEVQTPIGPYEIPTFPIEITISESATDLLTVDVSFGMNQTTSTIVDGDFVLAPVTETIDTPIGEVALTYSGTGMIVNDSEMNMDLEIAVLGNTSVCPMTMTKQ